MNVLAHDLRPDVQLAEELNFQYVSMPELLSQSDVISLHVAGGESTKNLRSKTEFQQMKDGVVLINTARGSVVDVQALLQALATGEVAAAGLDVIAEEPTIREEAELLSSIFAKRHNLKHCWQTTCFCECVTSSSLRTRPFDRCYSQLCSGI